MGDESIQDGAAADGAERRNRAIKRAVITSLASKAGTALMQLVSIPIAVRVLGREEFGLYASISMVITTVILLEIGVGPALTHGLSDAVARGDRERERTYYSTSFFMMLGLSLLGAFVLAGVVAMVPLSVMFGESYVGREAVMLPALWLGIGLFAAVLVLGHTDRAREGFMEVGHNNLWGGAGNLLAAASVGIGIWFFPNIYFLMIAVFGSQVLAKVGNTIHLWVRRSYLIPSLRAFRGAMAGGLLKDGLAFSAAYSVVGVVEFNVCANLIGRVGGPGEVAVYSMLVTLCVSALGFVLMVTTPTWPAVVDARARGDIAWIRTASRRLFLFALSVGVAAAIGLGLLGTTLLPLWLGDDFGDVPQLALLAFGFYFLMHVWRHVGHVLLMGMGRVRQLAMVQLAESAVILLPAWFGMQAFGLAGLLAAMALSILLMTGWALPLMFHRAVRALPGGSGSPPDQSSPPLRRMRLSR